MKKVAVLVLVAVSSGSSAFAGIVRFDPSEQDVVLGGDTTAMFDVYIDSSDMFAEDGFTGARIVIDSDDLEFTGIELDPTFRAFWLLIILDQGLGPWYKFDVDIGVINLFGTPIAAWMDFPALVGTISVDASGLGLGEYHIIVDSELDNGRSALANSNLGSDSEGLFGMATVNVIPEPTTLSLLGLAALGLISRLRKSA